MPPSLMEVKHTMCLKSLLRALKQQEVYSPPSRVLLDSNGSWPTHHDAPRSHFGVTCQVSVSAQRVRRVAAYLFGGENVTIQQKGGKLPLNVERKGYCSRLLAVNWRRMLSIKFWAALSFETRHASAPHHPLQYA